MPPLRRRLLSRLLRVSCLLQRSSIQNHPTGQCVSKSLRTALKREPPALAETSRAVTLQSKCRRRSCTRVYAAYAWTAAGSGVRSHGYFLAAICANFVGQGAARTKVINVVSSEPKVAQCHAAPQHGVLTWLLLRKGSRYFKHQISVTAFQNKTGHLLLPVNS